MKIIMILFILSYQLGCTVPAKKAINLEYVNAPVAAGTTAEKAIKELKRGGGSYAYYQVEAYPYTETLIRLQIAEKHTKNMSSKEEMQKALEEEIRNFVQSRTCFMFSLSTGSLESGMFKHWVAKLEDSSGKLHDITFANVVGGDSVPYYGQSFSGYTHHNSSVGCARKIDIVAGFKIHFIPQIDKHAKTSVLEWE